MLDRIKGGLVGLAIGDALGGTTEFLSREEIREKYGKVTDIIGGGVWHLKPGETTDDTAMTLAVANGIINDSTDPIPSIGMEFLKWYGTHPKDVGNIISHVLSQYHGNWFQTAKKVHYTLGEQSAGNGSLMRCLPVVFAYSNKALIDDITIQQSKMTHYDDLASEACVIYNRIAYRLLHNELIRDAIINEIKGTPYEEIIYQEPQVEPDGFVVNTMLWVMYLTYHYDDFTDIAIKAANNGGDSDTIAAIACGLKGIEVGFDYLPSDYKEKILLKHELEEVGVRLYEILHKS